MSSGGLERQPIRSLLLTGPSRDREEWLEAVAAAGWGAIDWPLIQIEALDVDITSELNGLPDWICVTSPNALIALELALKHLPELRAVPLAVVGERSAKRAARLGLKSAIAPAINAEGLASALLEELGDEASGKVVLWPRGSLAEELGTRLREAGVVVLDPVAYKSVAIAHDSPPPEATAVFFASPSAVRAWNDSVPETPSGLTAIAIGPTTASALQLESSEAFSDIQVLERASPEALAQILEA